MKIIFELNQESENIIYKVLDNYASAHECICRPFHSELNQYFKMYGTKEIKQLYKKGYDVIITIKEKDDSIVDEIVQNWWYSLVGDDSAWIETNYKKPAFTPKNKQISSSVKMLD